MELNLNSLESFLYESRPYVYVSVGMYALAVEQINVQIFLFALVLLFCGILVLRRRYRYRKGATLESLYYESLPFIYLSLGIYALVFLQIPRTGVASGVILLFCATKVFQWRIRNRRAIAAIINSDNKSSKAS